MEKLTRFLCESVVTLRGLKAMRTMTKALENVEAEQERVLFNILKSNSSTEYGMSHGFRSITNVEDFRANVPVVNYENLRPYLIEQDQTNRPVLYKGEPLYYAMTSGTTGDPKFIPVHKEALAAQKRCQEIFTYQLYKARPLFISGKMLSIVSPAVEGYMESGRAYGSTSGFMYADVPAIVRSRFVVPASVFKTESYDLKYLTILRLALQEENLTFITTANPSTVAKLVTVMEKNIEQLVNEIESGEFSHLAELDEEARQDVADRLVANPQRADQIRALMKRGRPRIQDLWPNLQAVAMWTGGSSSIFLNQLAGQFSEHTLIRDLGYLSSEFRGSVPILSRTNAGLPNLMSCYYEFVEQSEWESGNRNFVGLHQLQDQAKYYVFVTTDYGLYRYDMNDIVQVDGFYKGAPMIRFIQKGKGVTSITGEKLYESQVIAAVRRVEQELQIQSNFFVMRCDPSAYSYTLLYEPSRASAVQAQVLSREIADRIEEALCDLNVEYQAKRKSERLQKAKVAILAVGCFDEFRKFQVARGQRDGQFKIVALVYDRDLTFDFSKHFVAPTQQKAERKQTRPLSVVPAFEGSAI